MKYTGSEWVLNKSDWRKVESACKKVYSKTAGKYATKPLTGIFFLPDGKPAVCDEFRFYRLSEDRPDLPHVYGDSINNAVAPIAYIVEDAKERNAQSAALEFPDVETLKEHLKESPNVPYCVGGWVYFNVRYLLEVLTAFPGVVFRRPKTQTEPVYFESYAGDGIIMPIRPPLSAEEKAKREAERVARDEEYKREREEREAAERAEAERKEAERRAPFEGFLDGKSACAAGRIMRTMEKLIRYNGRIMTRTEYVKALLAEGYEPNEHKGAYYLDKLDTLSRSGLSRVGYKVTKTEYEFSAFLRESNFDDVNPAEIRAALEAGPSAFVKQVEKDVNAIAKADEPEPTDTPEEPAPGWTDTEYTDFEKAYRYEYSRLYFCGKSCMTDQAFSASVDEFSEKAANDSEFQAFLLGFNRFTKDCIASDREAAAFVNTYNAKKDEWTAIPF